MSIIFFPRKFIMLFKSIQAKQVELETSSLAGLLRDLMLWSSFHSLLRTYERSTRSKSIFLLPFLTFCIPFILNPVKLWLNANLIATEFQEIILSWRSVERMKPWLHGFQWLLGGAYFLYVNLTFTHGFLSRCGIHRQVAFSFPVSTAVVNTFYLVMCRRMTQSCSQDQWIDTPR